MTIEEHAIWLAKAVLKLDAAGYIQTYEQAEEADCEHLRRIAVHHAQKIKMLARTQPTEESNQ